MALDKIQSLVMCFLLCWSWVATQVEQAYRPFLQRKHELSIIAYYILWDNRITIPAKLRSQLIDGLHEDWASYMKTVAQRYF